MIAKPDMTLYCYGGYFSTNNDDVEHYCNEYNINLSNIYILEYYSFLLDSNDVIKRIESNGEYNYYKAIDKENYAIYNDKDNNEIKCNSIKGNINNLYIPFKNKGITFIDDVYEKKESKFNKIKRKIKNIK